MPVQSGARNAVVPVAVDGAALPVTSRSGAANSGGVSVPIAIDACSIDSSSKRAVCIDYGRPDVVVMDLTKFADTLDVADITQFTVTTDAPNRSTRFSGGSCVLCGIVAMTGTGTFVVSAFDGYRVYTLPSAATPSVTASITYPMPIGENFGVDVQRKWIVASEYESRLVSGTSTRRLRIIDLGKNKVYTWQVNTGLCSDRTNVACQAFARSEIDAAAIDPVTGIIVLQDESGLLQLLIDMTQATFDDATLSFSAPGSLLQLDQGAQSGETAGVLTSGRDNWLFMVSEFTSSGTIGVQKLPTAGGTGGTFPAYVPNPVFVMLSSLVNTACGPVSWFATDPHAQGYTVSIGGKPLGLAINGDKNCVAVIDLQGLHDAPRNPANPSNLASGFDPLASNLIRFTKVGN